MINPEPNEMSNIYFPYSTPGEEQVVIMSKINNLDLSKPRRIMINADTGSGKTIATLSSMLSLRQPDQKILVVVKTLNQINPYLREWASIQNFIRTNGDDEELTILPLLGRSQLCGLKHTIGKNTVISCYGSNRSQYRYSPSKFDRLKKSNHRYRLITWLTRKLVDNPSLTNFTQLLKTRENCPYENSISLAGQADIVVITYGFLMNQQMERVFGLMDSSPEDCLLILDEAHNLNSFQPMILHKSAIKIFQKIFIRNPFLTKIKEQMKGIRLLDLKDLYTTDTLQREMKTINNQVQKSKRLLDTYEGRRDKILPAALVGSKYIDIILDELEYLTNHYDRATMITSDKNISMIQLQPEKILRQIKDSPFIVFQSATLQPVDLYRRLFELKDDTIILDLINYSISAMRLNQREFRAYYAGPLVSRAANRNKELFLRYADIIIQLAEQIPGHVLVLCPSYDFGTYLHGILKKMQTNEREIILEQPTSSTKELTESIIKAKQPVLILGNQRGKILEGNEWISPHTGQSLVNLAIFAGLFSFVPMDQQELIDRVRTKILGNRSDSLLLRNQIPQYVAAKQALGRTRRQDDDRGSLVILDHRAGRYLRRHLWLSKYQEMDDLIDDLRIHFINYRVVLGDTS